MDTTQPQGQLALTQAGGSPVTAGLDSRQFLTFMLGGELYALGILNVKEIIEYGQLTEIPMMPPTIRGVINLRGAVVPVVDLAARFGSPPMEIQRRTCIIIVEVEQDEKTLEVGILVDAVSAVQDILPEDIEPAPSFGARVRSDFIAGMGKLDGKFVVILNSARVLSIDEMAVLADVRHAASDQPPAKDDSGPS